MPLMAVAPRGRKSNMLIYAMKPDRNGSVCSRGERFTRVGVGLRGGKGQQLAAAAKLDRFPDVFAISGWSKGDLVQ
jgi:hypothetical protein